MAGPKAPIGSLSAHSEKASALARGVSSASKNGPTSASSKRVNLKEESESDSSDSDSDASDSGGKAEDSQKFLQSIASKASGTKSKAAPSPAGKKAAAKKEESSSSDSSSESESDSEDDSSSESEDKKKKAAEPSKGAKLDKKPESSSSDKSKSKEVKKAESSSSDSSSSSSSSSSDSESEEEEAKPAKKAAAKSTETKAKSKPKTSSSSSSEASDSESESDEEADESMVIDQRNGNSVMNRVPEVVSNEFVLRKAEDGTNAADVAQFFSEAKKDGKQIWYFTAPASIPIEVVEKLEIPLERAQKGHSILSHNGDDYGVAFEDAATSRAIKLLIPSKAGDKYHILNAPIAQTMHLKRVTQFTQDGESTLSLTQTAHTATTRPARPQPKGLKARFAPIGIPSSSPVKIGSDGSDEDVDMTEAPALPSLPSSQKTPAKKSKSKDADTATDKKKKRKLDAVTDSTAAREADNPETSKKAKKARVESSQPTPKPKAAAAPSSATAGKVTPIAPPVIPSIRLNSSTVKKESAIPLPPNFQRASSSFSSQPPEEPKTNGKAKKEKQCKAVKSVAAATEAPKKTTPVPLPNIPTSS